jgi:hypothetical protein
MAFTSVHLQGGPCDGRYVSVSDTLLAQGYLTCQGVTYQIEGQAPGIYVGVPQTAGTGGALQDLVPDVYAGFYDLRRALTKKLRPALANAQRSNQIALHALPRIHRVKGR